MGSAVRLDLALPLMAGAGNVQAFARKGELVFVGSRSQVKPGQKVEPKIVEVLTAE